MMVDGGNGSNVIMMVDFVGHIDSLVKVAPITAALSTAMQHRCDGDVTMMTI